MSRFLRLISSVRLGVILLVLLGVACTIGMLVMQQNVEGFANYYQTLTPAQKFVYGRLKFFDIYHAWYFNALLALLSANIILASVDRFPRTWLFVSRPALTVPLRWMNRQDGSGCLDLKMRPNVVHALVESEFEDAGFHRAVVTRKNGLIYIFGQKGVWNRLGAYFVHIALLTIFLGGFLTARFGTTGQLQLAPGESSDRISQTVANLDRVSEITMQLPFEVAFTDIQQVLIRKDGPIATGNTIDWITRFTIKDETGVHEAEARLNRPFDFRGYRFFQSSFVPIGRARQITIRATDAAGVEQDLLLSRDGTATLNDGTKIHFEKFRGNFRVGPEDAKEDTTDYQNPAAVLKITPKYGPPLTAYAFGPHTADIPVAKNPVAGNTFQLLNFEKVSDQHILSVQRDPGTNVVYVGFVMLFITLISVFFFSHQRVWAAIEEKHDGECRVYVAGNANRNQNAIAETVAVLIERLQRANRKGDARDEQ